MKQKGGFGAFVWRLLKSLAGAVILSNVTGISISVLSTNRLARVVSVGVTLLVSFLLLYLAAHEEGDLDTNRVAFGRSNARWYKGFTAGALACSPLLLLSLLLVATRLGLGAQMGNLVLTVYRFAAAPFYALNITLLPTMLNMAEQSVGSVIMAAALPLLLPVVSGMAYAMGFAQFSVGEHLMYHKK